jgi:hypothetical protein
MPDQPDQPQQAPAPENAEETPAEQPAPSADEAPPKAAEEAAGQEADPEQEPPQPRGRRIVRPWEALERLDRQWDDRTPIRERDGVSSLVLTVPEDPSGFDYLGAMGLSEGEVADACERWLDAQLAADALELGRLARPVVALVPASRLWFVVRLALGSLVLIDGPGYLTPTAAVKGARVRYRALLLAEVERAAGARALDDVEADEVAEPDGAAEPDPAVDQPPASE